MRLTRYWARYVGQLRPAAEMEEMMRLRYRHRAQMSAVDQLIFDWLRVQLRLLDA